MQTEKLGQLAVIGIVVGILLHVCAAYAILGGSDEPPRLAPVRQETVAAQQQTPVPSVLPDRRDCNAIRNTEYRSAAERQWFLANCTGSFVLPTAGYSFAPA